MGVLETLGSYRDAFSGILLNGTIAGIRKPCRNCITYPEDVAMRIAFISVLRFELSELLFQRPWCSEVHPHPQSSYYTRILLPTSRFVLLEMCMNGLRICENVRLHDFSFGVKHLLDPRARNREVLSCPFECSCSLKSLGDGLDVCTFADVLYFRPHDGGGRRGGKKK